MAQRMRGWTTDNPDRTLFHAAKSRAQKKGIEFTITPADVVIPEVCPVFGTPLRVKSGETLGGIGDAPSLDRIDNSRGYVLGNVAVISSRANRLKSDSSVSELKAIIAYMEKYGLP